MYITAMNHPDHNTINNFRKNNAGAFKQVFVQVLLLAQSTGIMKKLGTISVDGTKIHANASRHKAVSYKYAKEQIAKYEKEVADILEQAEKIDNTENEISLPEEIAVREKRISVLKEAVRQMEETQKEICEHEKEEYERKIKESDEDDKKNGKTVQEIFEKLPVSLPEEKDDVPITTGMMKARLKTVQGQKIYSKRKTTVEPVFGIIKRVMGFQQFLMRGLEKIDIEWNLVTISYNISRMFSLKKLQLTKI